MEHKEQILSLIKNCKSHDISLLVDEIIKFNIEVKQKEENVVFEEDRNIIISDLVKEARLNSSTRSEIRELILHKYKDIDSWHRSNIDKYKILINRSDETLSDVWRKFCSNKDCYYKGTHFLPRHDTEYYRFILDSDHMLCDMCIDNIEDYTKTIVKPKLIDEIVSLV